MKVADAHCDTLTKFPDNPFDSPDAAWNTEKFSSAGGILQYFAIWTPAQLSGDAALSYAFSHLGRFYRHLKEPVNLIKKSSDFSDDKINILLSLEGAAPIINDISNLHAFYKLGIRAMTLTWNHRNFLADGIDNDYGLTSFGMEAIREMESLGIIVDVSHLNESGFKDVCKIADKPFIASHSNSYKVCPTGRNLKDYQVREIIERKGFIGINFYSDFISSNTSDLTGDFLKHIEHIINLGGENVLGWGADFDGMDSSPFPDATYYNKISEMLTGRLGLGNELTEKIMYGNLLDFTLNNLG